MYSKENLELFLHQKNTERKKHIKLKKDFLPYESNGEVMLVAAGSAQFSGLVRGNKILGDILELLKDEITEAGIVEKMREKYEAPEGKIEADVHKAVTELAKIGAIEGK